MKKLVLILIVTLFLLTVSALGFVLPDPCTVDPTAPGCPQDPCVIDATSEACTGIDFCTANPTHADCIIVPDIDPCLLNPFAPGCVFGPPTDCQAGQYGDTGGFPHFGICKACPAETTSPPGSVGILSCSISCSTSPEAPGCVIPTCEANQYLNENVCTSCPSGGTSPAGSTSIDACACPANTYKFSIFGTASCLSCPPGTHSPLGSDSVGDCQPIVCEPNTYLSGNSCQACPQGTTSPLGSTSPSQCIDPCDLIQIDPPQLELETGPQDILCEEVICGPNAFLDGRECESCPRGTISPSGSTSIDDCETPPKVLKQEARDILEDNLDPRALARSLRGSATTVSVPYRVDYLIRAMRNIDASLEGFETNSELNERTGLEVFDHELRANAQLYYLLRQRQTPSHVRKDVRVVQELLGDADRLIAMHQLEEAKSRAADTRDRSITVPLRKADGYYQSGLNHLRRGNVKTAIKRFRTSWIYSRQALNRIDTMRR